MYISVTSRVISLGLLVLLSKYILQSSFFLLLFLSVYGKIRYQSKGKGKSLTPERQGNGKGNAYLHD